MNNQITTRESLRFMAHGYYFSCALFAAVRLGIADALALHPRTAADLAAQIRTHPDTTARLLRLLASVGICEEDADHRFGLTEVGQNLRSDHPASMCREISMFSGGETYEAWGNVVEAVKTGKSAFELLHDRSLFSYLSEHPEPAERFHKGWEEITAQVALQTAELYDFSGVSTLTDVGGGYGIFLGTLLQQQKGLKGVLFDLPFSVEGAPATLQKFGVSERVVVLTGNAENSVPPMEMVLLKSVIHVCSSEQAQRILSNCAAALPVNGKALVLERIVPPGNTFHWSKLVDMTMAVMTGGRERTVEDYVALYERSGMRLTRTIELPSGFSIIEGTKV